MLISLATTKDMHFEKELQLLPTVNYLNASSEGVCCYVRVLQSDCLLSFGCDWWYNEPTIDLKCSEISPDKCYYIVLQAKQEKSPNLEWVLLVPEAPPSSALLWRWCRRRRRRRQVGGSSLHRDYHARKHLCCVTDRNGLLFASVRLILPRTWECCQRS